MFTFNLLFFTITISLRSRETEFSRTNDSADISRLMKKIQEKRHEHMPFL